MKIMLIQPGTFSSEEVKGREDYARSVCTKQTIIIMASVPEPEVTPIYFPTLNVLVPGVLERIREAKQQDCDAVVLDCVADVGLEAARSIADIPIIGPFESSMHLAHLLADKFGLIIPRYESIPSCWRLARSHGMADRVATIKALNIPFLEFRDNKENVEAKLTTLAKESVSEGSQLIIIGCTSLFPALGIGSAQRLSKKTDIQFVDIIGLSLKMAELMVSLNLKQSKLAYPRG
jgi:allantoin racemase